VSLVSTSVTRINIPTQLKATQLVVAIAVWANAISARGARPDLSILLLNDASEQCHIIVGQQCIVSIGQHCVMANCYLLKRRKEIKMKKRRNFWRRVAFRESHV
jgi:hypothetical protein